MHWTSVRGAKATGGEGLWSWHKGGGGASTGTSSMPVQWCEQLDWKISGFQCDKERNYNPGKIILILCCNSSLEWSTNIAIESKNHPLGLSCIQGYFFGILSVHCTVYTVQLDSWRIWTLNKLRSTPISITAGYVTLLLQRLRTFPVPCYWSPNNVVFLSMSLCSERSLYVPIFLTVTLIYIQSHENITILTTREW